MARFLIVVVLACSCSGPPPPSSRAHAAGAPQSPNATPGGPTDPAPSGSPPAASDPTLLDANVQTILAVSPDAKQLLVARQPLPQCICCTSADAVEVLLLSVGAGAVPLGFNAHTAWFSPDGRFIRSTEDTCEGTANQSWIVRADGTGLRPLPGSGYTFAGSWLYSSHARAVYRQRDLDDAPQSVLQSDTSGGLAWVPSPDGDAIAYCNTDAATNSVLANCRVQAPVGATPVQIPAPNPDSFRWSTDGSFLFSPPCTIYERASQSVWSCDSSSLAPPDPEALPAVAGNPFVDDAVIAFVTRDPGGFVVHVRTISTGDEVVLPSLPWLPGVRVTPDHATVVASSRNFVPSLDQLQTIAAVPAHGGQWSILSDDAMDAFIAPSGSLAVMNSRSTGVVASVAGGPAHSITPPDLTLYTIPVPLFEPPGGLDKVMFFAGDSANIFHMAIGNADGTGEWVRLPPEMTCEWWAGHSAACAGPGDAFFIVPDSGNTPKLIVRKPRQIVASGTKLFYIDATGLHIVDNP